ncbi:MAG: tetratricopeptide repeat protein [Candidatus Jordarchaeaceae archaeon]
MDSQEVGPEEKAAQILYLAGVRLLSEGDGRKALQRLEKASEIYTKKGSKTDVAKCYKQMGNVYAFHEEWEKAETCYKKAIELEKEAKNWSSFIENLFLMSNLMMDKNELEKAIKYAQEAEKISKKAKDEKSQFQAYKQMGLIYERKGDLEKAKESFQKATKIAEKLKLPETETGIIAQEILWILQKEKENKNKKQ